MSEITEIQDMVFGGMKIKAPPSIASTSLLDYFVPRQYIQIYPQNLIIYSLQDIGVFLLKFATMVDLKHPDLSAACEGQFATNSNFCDDVLEVLETGKLLLDANRGTNVPKILTSSLLKRYNKVISYIGSPVNYIRLVKEPVGRLNLRVFASKTFKLNLAKSHIWRKIPGTFKPFCRRGPGNNYGFHRMTMTNASVILAKLTNYYTRHSKISSFIPNRSHHLSVRFSNFIDDLENFPDAGHKPIFDKYWLVECGPNQALLGEIDKKCYFIICW